MAAIRRTSVLLIEAKPLLLVPSPFLELEEEDVPLLPLELEEPLRLPPELLLLPLLELEEPPRLLPKLPPRDPDELLLLPLEPDELPRLLPEWLPRDPEALPPRPGELLLRLPPLEDPPRTADELRPPLDEKRPWLSLRWLPRSSSSSS
ncbi:hypothetical protein D3C86_1740760 [compost metagenome]